MPTVQQYRTNVVNQINGMVAGTTTAPGGAPFSDAAKAMLNEYKNYANGVTGSQPLQEFGSWMRANKDRLSAVPGGQEAYAQIRASYNGYAGDTPPSPPPPPGPLQQAGRETFNTSVSLPIDSQGYVPPAVTTTEMPGQGQQQPPRES